MTILENREYALARQAVPHCRRGEEHALAEREAVLLQRPPEGCLGRRDDKEEGCDEEWNEVSCVELPPVVA
ncbi:hypothetical protein Acr_25g0010260 [Actinidia rufa]|uniref:Uncharacterized protein n=1 Tax=Actinidia rufa TaxID=165716 RepID=A0A7J0H0J5_9ERIC|nr:hypothetical protein Acr_25g0010260 [Actinidia rufa]